MGAAEPSGHAVARRDLDHLGGRRRLPRRGLGIRKVAFEHHAGDVGG